jgi:hypothetical protein
MAQVLVDTSAVYALIDKDGQLPQAGCHYSPILAATWTLAFSNQLRRCRVSCPPTISLGGSNSERLALEPKLAD